MTTNNTTTIALPQKMRGTATVYNDLTGGQARCDVLLGTRTEEQDVGPKATAIMSGVFVVFVKDEHELHGLHECIVFTTENTEKLYSCH